MDACRGKNCRMKHIHSTYSSCHRWWNKICRQLICVTNCGCLVFEFKVFAAEVEPLLQDLQGGFSACHGLLHVDLSTLAPSKSIHVICCCTDAACVATNTSAAVCYAPLACPSAEIPFGQPKLLFPSLLSETQKLGLVLLDSPQQAVRCREPEKVLLSAGDGGTTTTGGTSFVWTALHLSGAVGCRNGSR